jgi:hypothetical protein
VKVGLRQIDVNGALVEHPHGIDPLDLFEFCHQMVEGNLQTHKLFTSCFSLTRTPGQNQSRSANN